MPASLTRRILAVPAFLLLAACASKDPVPAEYRNVDLGETSQAITAAAVVSRAMDWVNAKLLYCQAPNHHKDYDSACPSTCNRTNNSAWDPYRSDCSGLISWAWGLPAPGRVTSEFAPYNTGVSHEISPSDLAPGDALNSTPDEHIILFKEWTVKGSEATFIEEPGCSVNPNYAHQFTSKVTINSNKTIHVSYTGMTFYAIRFDSITTQSPDWAATFVKQSWPYASAAPIELTAGEVKKGSIDLKNTGSKTWPKGVVKLAPVPRDKKSNLAASTWESGTRVSAVTTDVKPGETGHFEWDLEGSAPGSSKPFFGLVAEGMAWFADSGGPPDNDLQVNVHVVAAPPSSTGAGGGGASGEGGAKGEAGAAGQGGAKTGHAGEGGAESDGGAGGETSAAGGAPAKGGSAGAPGTAGHATGSAGTSPASAGQGGVGGAAASNPGDAGAGGAEVVLPLNEDSEGQTGGCEIGGGRRADGFVGVMAIAGMLVAARRARRARVSRA